MVQKNISEHPIRIAWGWPYEEIVHDQQGKELQPKSGLSGGSSADITLEPGQTFSEYRDLTSKFDLTAPGTYVVRFRRHVNFSDPKSPAVDSNEIIIKIVPAKVLEQR